MGRIPYLCCKKEEPARREGKLVRKLGQAQHRYQSSRPCVQALIE